MEEKLKKIMAETFKLDENALNEETKMSKVESWDSLSHLQLIAALEEAFGMEIDMDDMLAMTGYKEILEILKK